MFKSKCVREKSNLAISSPAFKFDKPTFNVEELKKARGNVRYDMTPEELREYQMKQNRQEDEESRRQALIRDRDNQISTTYDKTHERMLGWRGAAPS